MVFVDVASSGMRVLSASFDGTVRIWTIKSNDDPVVLSMQVLDRHGQNELPIVPVVITSNVFSNHVRYAKFIVDDSRVVTLSTDRIARLWDADTGATLQEFGSSATSSAFGFCISILPAPLGRCRNLSPKLANGKSQDRQPPWRRQLDACDRPLQETTTPAPAHGCPHADARPLPTGHGFLMAGLQDRLSQAR